jgi:acetylornithine deacetylase
MVVGRPNIQALLLELVEMDSTNPSLAKDGPGEGEIGRFIANWLERAGLEVTLDEVAPGRPNVTAVVRGSGGGRSLILHAHTDTARVGGCQKLDRPKILGNRLYGHGAYDMKASLAAIMLVAAVAKRWCLRGDVILAAVIDEEYSSLGTRSLVSKCSADAAIVTEPTGLNICTAHPGTVLLEVALAKGGKSERYADTFDDMIAALAKTIAGLKLLNWRLRERQHHRLLGNARLRVSLLRDGQMAIRPQLSLITLSRLTLPGETLDGVENEIRSVLATLPFSGAAYVTTLRTVDVRPAFEVSEDQPIVRILRGSANLILRREPPIVGSKAWMDSAILLSAGIPTVIFGPGGAGAHLQAEWVDLDQVQQCYEVLLSVVKEFCA